MISIIRAVGNWAVPLTQLVSLLVVMLFVEQFWGAQFGTAIFYGGMVSVVNLLWLQWRLRRSERRQPVEVIEEDAEQGARKIAADLYMTAAERLILVTALFLLGMVKLKLNPMALIVGFVVGQLAMLVGSWRYGATTPAETNG